MAVWVQVPLAVLYAADKERPSKISLFYAAFATGTIKIGMQYSFSTSNRTPTINDYPRPLKCSRGILWAFRAKQSKISKTHPQWLYQRLSVFVLPDGRGIVQVPKDPL